MLPSPFSTVVELMGREITSVLHFCLGWGCTVSDYLLARDPFFGSCSPCEAAIISLAQTHIFTAAFLRGGSTLCIVCLCKFTVLSVWGVLGQENPFVLLSSAL